MDVCKICDAVDVQEIVFNVRIFPKSKYNVKAHWTLLKLTLCEDCIKLSETIGNPCGFDLSDATGEYIDALKSKKKNVSAAFEFKCDICPSEGYVRLYKVHDSGEHYYPMLCNDCYVDEYVYKGIKYKKIIW